MHDPRCGLVRSARPTPAEQGGAFGQVLGLDEQLAERRVGQVVGSRGENDLGIAGDVDLARALAVVGDGQPAHLHVVLGRDSDVEVCANVLLTAAERGLVDEKRGHVFL